MLKRCIFSIIVFSVIFICLISMMCPIQNMARFVPDSLIVKQYFPKDLVSTSGASISEDGYIEMTGSNPNIYLDGIDCDTKTIAIKFKGYAEKSFSALMYYDTGNGLNESEKVYSAVFEGDEWLCFTLPETSYCKAARIDIYTSYSLDQVNVYDCDPVTIESPIPNPWWEYVICIVIAIFVAFVFFCVDSKHKIAEKIFAFLKTKYKAIFFGVLIILVCVLLSFGVEFICGKIFGASTNGEIFNVYRYLLICGILLTFSAFAVFVSHSDKKPEKLFLAIMLVVGLVMIFASPFGHISWDVESHYEWALDSSYIGYSYKTPADQYVTSNRDLYLSKESALDNENNIALLNDMENHVVEKFALKKSITHVPSGVVIALARFFNMNFYWKLTLGRVPNLLIYTFACYFGMKKLKSGKMIFAVLAFFPTNLFLATNYSYDYWVNGFLMLGIAYFVSEMQQPNKQISVKDSIIMCASLAVACIPKQIYAPLLIIPFFLKKFNFEKKRRYYTICMLGFALLLLSLALRSITSITSAGDLRGGSDVGPTSQVKYILSQPFEYANTLIKFLWSYLSIGSAREYICNMAYVGYGFGHNILLALMIITAFTDKNEYDLNNKYGLIKTLNMLLLVGLSALTATALYISFTAVGSDTIVGCQGRYVFPMLPPVLLIIGSGFINNTMNRKWYNSLIIGACAMVSFVSVALTMTSRLL